MISRRAAAQWAGEAGVGVIAVQVTSERLPAGKVSAPAGLKAALRPEPEVVVERPGPGAVRPFQEGRAAARVGSRNEDIVENVIGGRRAALAPGVVAGCRTGVAHHRILRRKRHARRLVVE